MGAILKGLDRDILFNLCQYGMGDVSTWGREVGGHSWRTTGDLGLEKDTRLPGFYSIAFKNQRFAAYAQPGGWNDPDYILIGHIGNARNIDEPPRLTTLTPDEQYSYLSMWALMASPLFYSGHMGRLDEFTLNVLCNAEVIEINQDALGKQATAVAKSGDAEVWVKDLEEGAKAVGLLNFGETETRIEVRWADLGFAGKARVRDVWRQRDLGVFAERFSASAPRHGVVLVRVSR
jgi:alpha-galactosidase